VDEVSEPLQPVATPQPDLTISRPTGGEEKPVTFTVGKDRLAMGVHTHTCPQCGMNPAGAPKARKFQFIPPWVYLGFLANVIVFLILYLIGRKQVDTQLSLCDDCDAADKRGRRVRTLSVVGAIFAPLGALLGGLALDLEVAAVVASGVALVGGIVGSVIAHRKTRGDVILVKKIDKTEVQLLASPRFPQVLAREAPDLLVGGASADRTAKLAL
jgi:hypothetical protein